MSEPRLHVLTGAGSGMGHEIARRLVDRGDRVIMLVRSEDRVDAVADAFPDFYAVLVCDLADPAAVQQFVTDFTTGRPRPERIDSLLHVAGVVDLAPVAELDVAAWQHQLDVNLTAPAILTAGLLPALRAAHGTVVFVNSGAGQAANAGWSAYAASKFGLRALADALRAEEAPHGVRVTTVYPGRTASPMQEKVHAQEGAAYDPDRWIRPGTVADTVLHVLDLPADATIPEITVRPGPGG